MLTAEREKEIRERLECFKYWKRKEPAEWSQGPGPDIESLLAEIDRLRVEKESWGNEYSAVMFVKEENQTLRARIEKLREALRQVYQRYGSVTAHEALSQDAEMEKKG